jgi:hypothetical protein
MMSPQQGRKQARRLDLGSLPATRLTSGRMVGESGLPQDASWLPSGTSSELDHLASVVRRTQTQLVSQIRLAEQAFLLSRQNGSEEV